MLKKKILIVEDEKDIQRLLQYNLQKEGYGVFVVGSGEEGFEQAKTFKPDLIILDWMLPGMDGLEVCRMLKASPATAPIPVLMLTAKDSDVDQVVGLEMGASEYLSKPFSIQVLLARIKNIFRSSAKTSQSLDSSSWVCGPFEIHPEKHQVLLAGKPLVLTKIEFGLVCFLMKNVGKVCSRQALLDGAWKDEAFVVDRTVDVHVKSIRKKLGKHRDWIETVRGTGYRFKEGPLN